MPAERLTFSLPPFTRLCWVNDRAREVWGPRFQSILRAWSEVEWRSVAIGIRQSALLRVSTDRIDPFLYSLRDVGLTGVALRTFGNEPDMAGNATSAGELLAVGGTGAVNRLREAYAAGDDAAVGHLLGYPPCCVAMYLRVCVQERFLDPTWAIASSTSPPVMGDIVDLRSVPVSNILWRSVGIRAIAHLPCHFGCRDAIDLGRQFIDAAIGAGFRQEANILLDVLSWPVEWSSLHGIAELKTPIMKVITRTDAFATKLTVRLLGTTYPPEGATGTTFPYIVPLRHARELARCADRTVTQNQAVSPGAPNEQFRILNNTAASS
jgi:hypothetical protein